MSDGVDYSKKMPLCLRKYSRGDIECDGRAGARVHRDSIPCVYRDRCVAFQKLISIHGVKVKSLLRLRKIRDDDGKRRVYSFSVQSSEKFQNHLTRIIDCYGIVNGRITIKHPKKELKVRRRPINRSQESKEKSIKALVGARKVATKVIKEKARDDLLATKDLFNWFSVRLQETTKKKIYASSKGIDFGDFFVVDRIKPSRYLTVYSKVAYKKANGSIGSKRIPVACAFFCRRTRALQFKLTLSCEQIKLLSTEDEFRKLCPSEFIEGRFKCKTLQLGKEGCSIIADLLSRAIENGLINVGKL